MHFLAVKLDRCTRLQRSASGEIRVADLQLVSASAPAEDCVRAARLAIINLRISNGIAVSYLLVLGLHAFNVLSNQLH